MIESLGKLLEYGAAGLSLALAILSFFLLRAEQKHPEPRTKILVSIYVFMTFSMILFGASMASKFYLEKTPIVLDALSENTSDDAWNDLVQVTRDKVSDSLQLKVSMHNSMREGQNRLFEFAITPGGCWTYFVMSRPPSELSVSVIVNSTEPTVHKPLWSDPHLKYGRICVPKATADAPVSINLSEIGAGGTFVAEAFAQ